MTNTTRRARVPRRAHRCTRFVASRAASAPPRTSERRSARRRPPRGTPHTRRTSQATPASHRAAANPMKPASESLSQCALGAPETERKRSAPTPLPRDDGADRGSTQQPTRGSEGWARGAGREESVLRKRSAISGRTGRPRVRGRRTERARSSSSRANLSQRPDQHDRPAPRGSTQLTTSPETLGGQQFFAPPSDEGSVRLGPDPVEVSLYLSTAPRVQAAATSSSSRPSASKALAQSSASAVPGGSSRSMARSQRLPRRPAGPWPRRPQAPSGAGSAPRGTGPGAPARGRGSDVHLAGAIGGQHDQRRHLRLNLAILRDRDDVLVEKPKQRSRARRRPGPSRRSAARTGQSAPAAEAGPAGTARCRANARPSRHRAVPLRSPPARAGAATGADSPTRTAPA